MKSLLKNKFSILIILIFLLSIVAHFWFFWQPPLTGDETGPALKAIRIANGIRDLLTQKNTQVALKNLYEPILQHNYPPIEYLIFLPFLAFAPREFFLRLSSVLINISLLFGVFLFLKKFRNKIVALSFLILYGTSRWAIWWGQSATVIPYIIASFFICVSIIYFLKKPSNRAMFFMALSSSFGLLVSVDFIQAAPFVGLAILEKRKLIPLRNLIINLIIFLAITSIFYVPWIFYSINGGPHYAGFNYYLDGRLQQQSNILFNLRILWQYALSRAGYFTVWPFALFSFFLLKKQPYVKYIFTMAFSYILLFVLFGTGVNWYHNVFPMFSILAAEFIASLKKQRKIILAIILILNLFSLRLLFLNNTHNQILFTQLSNNDEIKKVGEIAKKCIKLDSETYLTTATPSVSEYYFGRRPLFASSDRNGRIILMKSFLNNEKPGVVLIHYKTGQLEKSLEKQLLEKSKKTIRYQNDVVLLFKDCM